MPNQVIDDLQWCPALERCLLAVCNEEFVFLVAPELYKKEANEGTKEIFNEAQESYKLEVAANEKKENLCKWRFYYTGSKKDSKEDTKEETTLDKHIVASMEFKIIISRLDWHPRGDYLSTMAHNIQATS